MSQLDKVVHVDQGPIGRTPRSNPATYTGVFDHVRKLFAATTEAKVRGYQPGRFSFNVKGGRCEACAGDGTIKIEMQFLPDVYVPCEVCHGARYNTDTLAVHYKGKTIAEVLDMPIEEAGRVLRGHPGHRPAPEDPGRRGPGLRPAGPAAPTLSGGEAQRVKLAFELRRRSTGRTIYVLDEPTTGCTSKSIRQLLGVLGWWTAATPSSSSSTTSTGSKPPTGSSTSAPTAGPRRRGHRHRHPNRSRGRRQLQRARRRSRRVSVVASQAASASSSRARSARSRRSSARRRSASTSRHGRVAARARRLVAAAARSSARSASTSSPRARSACARTSSGAHQRGRRAGGGARVVDGLAERDRPRARWPRAPARRARRRRRPRARRAGARAPRRARSSAGRVGSSRAMAAASARPGAKRRRAARRAASASASSASPARFAAKACA